MLLDLKAACRELLKSRWFTCVTVLTLALGIGANTAIFAVVNKLLLNPLPYPDAERLVYVGVRPPQGAFTFPVSHAVAGYWQEQARSLDDLEVYERRTLLAYDDRGARVVSALRITPGLPAFLGVAPVLGRGFTAADTEAGAPPVVLLSYGVWQRDYAGASDVLGRTITLDDVAHAVIGVMPARWDAFAGSREMWQPLSLDIVDAPFDLRAFEVLARLRPGVSHETVASELDALATRAVAEVSERGFIVNGRAHVTAPSIVGTGTRDALLVLLAAVGLVLLVACANVANLLLARGASRARALALKSVLGASAWRLVRALFAECLVLALAAGACGAALGWFLLSVIVRMRPNGLAALADVTLEPRVLAVTFGVAVATAFLFGVAPALQLRSSKLAHTLRHGAAGVVRSGGARVRKLLVVAQMAMSVVLLVSAALLIRSVVHLQSVDLGFDTTNLFTVQMALPRERYREPPSRDVVSEQLLERIRAMPGVVAATQAFGSPPYGGMLGVRISIRGVTLSDADQSPLQAANDVRPDYFAALGIGLLEGRTFMAEEMRGGAVLVVNRAAVQRYWPNGGALGAEVSLGRDDWQTVVGVVDNAAIAGATLSRDVPIFYSPFRTGSTSVAGAPPTVTLIVRAAEEPASVIAAVRAAIRALDPEIAVPNVTLTEAALANVFAVPRFNMALLVAFAVVALVLAAVGLAAVIGYEVTERTHEFGVRMALGARTENVRRLAMRHGLTPAFIGVAIGMIGALGATRLATSMLHGVAPRDPLTFVGVVALLVLVALGASWLPARRATRVDPITALRAD